jgi:ribonuclease D
MADLKEASVLAVDCEGVSLGRVGSRLSLLQVATPSTTYIFDLQARFP